MKKRSNAVWCGKWRRTKRTRQKWFDMEVQVNIIYGRRFISTPYSNIFHTTNTDKVWLRMDKYCIVVRYAKRNLISVSRGQKFKMSPNIYICVSLCIEYTAYGIVSPNVYIKLNLPFSIWSCAHLIFRFRSSRNNIRPFSPLFTIWMPHSFAPRVTCFTKFIVHINTYVETFIWNEWLIAL